MNRETLVKHILDKNSYLCVGLDPDSRLLPDSFSKTPVDILRFNKRIIDGTKDFCVAYKPNVAFYESLGVAGWEILQETIAYIPESHFVIADAKRGDIGNTSSHYAHAFFHHFKADAITVAPYMGQDSVIPFFQYPEKWVVILGLTSNPGSKDFQFLSLPTGETLYQKVIREAKSWGSEHNCMFVVGATHPNELSEIRSIIPNHFILIPGVGAQGGNLEEISKYGLMKEVGLLVNVGRSIMFASKGSDFEKAATCEAKKIQLEMKALLEKYLIPIP
jgi:orotidine-5'-phosphate decarboxylase